MGGGWWWWIAVAGGEKTEGEGKRTESVKKVHNPTNKYSIIQEYNETTYSTLIIIYSMRVMF